VRALITGVAGFAGGHLAELLAGSGHEAGPAEERPALELHGTVFAAEPLPEVASRVQLHTVDLRDGEATRALVAAVAPDYLFHLAAQSYVPDSWRAPWETFATNVQATLNLLEAVRAAGRGRVLVVGSNEEYGAAPEAELPLREDSPLRPVSPYAVSKVAQDLLGLSYHSAYGLDVVRVRPFNHIGPRQDARFVAGALARQVAAIELGLAAPVVYAGNLDAARDFTDVRDVVAAYWLALSRGTPGAVYNIASGRPRAVRELLAALVACSGRSIEVALDPARARPADIPVSYGDAGALRAATGWAPRIPFERTVQDILADWRARLRRGEAPA
jgi:GDP-4-dehydro-6-deoxy-D-mannose reductase